MTSEKVMKLTLSYDGLTASFEGPPEEVLRSVISFVESKIASFSLARKLAVDLDVQRLIESLSKLIAYHESEGFLLKSHVYSLPASEQILILLAKRYLEHYFGKATTNTLSFKEVVNELNLKRGTASSNLNELVRRGLAKRHGKGDYSITVNGLLELTSKFAGQG